MINLSKWCDLPHPHLTLYNHATATARGTVPGSAANRAKRAKAGAAQGANSIPSEDEAKKTMKVLGEGIEGTVYADEKNGVAIKYFSGNFNPDNVAESISEGRLLAEFGVGPKIIAADAKRGVIKMELLKGYKDGLSPHDVRNAEHKPFAKSFLGQVASVQRRGYTLTDLHEDNIMFNQSSKNVKFVDRGPRRASSRRISDQLFDTTGDRPLAAQELGGYIKNFGTKAQKKEFKALQKAYRGATSPDEFSGKKENTDPKFYATLNSRTHSLINSL